MAENLAAVRVHAGDGAALHGHLLDTAEEVAVELHALGIGGVGLDGFLAVLAAHADVQQVFHGSLGVFPAHQRGHHVQPCLMVLVPGHLGEQFDERTLNPAQEIVRGGLGHGAEGEQADQSENDGKNSLHFKDPPLWLVFFNRR